MKSGETNELSSENPTSSTGAERDVFATTHWTAVIAAGRGSSAEAEVALEELCHAYWFPLYVYVRRQTPTREDAEDLTQAFFARFLEKNYLEKLSVQKGKFRAFLLAALKHFLANEWDRASRQKRGGGVAPLSLDWQDADARYQIEPVDNSSPDKLYDRAWAVTLLEQVLRRLRDENATEDQTRVFEQLKGFLMVGTSAIPYGEAAARLHLSEGAVRVAVHRLRRRYRELLREEISQTLSDATQIAEEMRTLFSAFAN
ncbi:MAG TPA: ECF-type sigma factor [Candidatus Acidoferrum sp.]|nr:ECF-type sigma factor [Candidatus Acidoferrum sp.]